jgi:hypothetical protein
MGFLASLPATPLSSLFWSLPGGASSPGGRGKHRKLPSVHLPNDVSPAEAEAYESLGLAGEEGDDGEGEGKIERVELRVEGM